jgi:hypothetical protein
MTSVFLKTPSRNIEGAPQHEPEVLLRTVPGHGDLFPPHFDVDPNAQIVAVLPMAMRDVGNHMTGNDPGAQRVQLPRAFANFRFDDRIGLHTGERDRDRLPHA